MPINHIEGARAGRRREYGPRGYCGPVVEQRDVVSRTDTGLSVGGEPLQRHASERVIELEGMWSAAAAGVFVISRQAFAQWMPTDRAAGMVRVGGRVACGLPAFYRRDSRGPVIGHGV